MSARRLLISGRVQGVGYREWLIAEASRRGVAGWVRNRRDGTVEALLDAAPDAVAELIRLCRHGPPSAAVTDIKETPAEPSQEPGFRRLPTA